MISTPSYRPLTSPLLKTLGFGSINESSVNVKQNKNEKGKNGLLKVSERKTFVQALLYARAFDWLFDCAYFVAIHVGILSKEKKKEKCHLLALVSRYREKPRP